MSCFILKVYSSRVMSFLSSCPTSCDDAHVSPVSCSHVPPLFCSRLALSSSGLDSGFDSLDILEVSGLNLWWVSVSGSRVTTQAGFDSSGRISKQRPKSRRKRNWKCLREDKICKRPSSSQTTVGLSGSCTCLNFTFLLNRTTSQLQGRRITALRASGVFYFYPALSGAAQTIPDFILLSVFLFVTKPETTLGRVKCSSFK